MKDDCCIHEIISWKSVLLQSVLGMLLFFPEKPDAEAGKAEPAISTTGATRFHLGHRDWGFFPRVPDVKAGISGDPGPERRSSAGRSRVWEMPLGWEHSELWGNLDSDGWGRVSGVAPAEVTVTS